MKATSWEFTNRALLFGLVFGVGFPLSAVDHQNAAAALANMFHADGELVIHLLFYIAAMLVAAAALVRTWASSYLHATVVYADRVKTESLVADGPYRYVRNPLYVGNILLTLGVGALMSRLGLVFAVTAVIVICYRLILREEFELHSSQGASYERYRNAVPRLCPALRPRIASAGSSAHWRDGFRAEFWCWGLAAASTAFAVTLNVKVSFVFLIPSLALLWFAGRLSSHPPAAG